MLDTKTAKAPKTNKPWVTPKKLTGKRLLQQDSVNLDRAMHTTMEAIQAENQALLG